MPWEKASINGQFLIRDEIQDGLGRRNARKFLDQVFRNFISVSGKYFDATCELPFIYREKQIHSILFPSIEKVADAALMEHPIRRGTCQKNRWGWVDYWALFNSTVFLIELKHSWQSLTSNSTRKYTQEAWQSGIAQIRSITNEESENFVWSNQNLVKLVIEIVPCYYGKSRKFNFITPKKKSASEILDKVYATLNPNPCWSGLWLLNERFHKKPFQYKSRFEVYPLLMFFVYIE